MFKSRLSVGKDFNIVYKGGKRLYELANEANVEKKAKRDDDESMKTESGVVYMLTCLKCKNDSEKMAHYIGETSRTLDDRLKEHCRKVKIENEDDRSMSAVAVHSNGCHGSQPNHEDWGIKILGREKLTRNRKLLEALWIYHVNLN